MIRDLKGFLTISAAVLIVALIAGCSGVTMKNYPTAEEQYQQSLKEFQKKHYIKAIDGFQKVVYNFSGASMVDSAQYYIAMSQFKQREYYLAAAEFERLVNTYPGSSFVDEAQYMSGLCYFKSAPGNYGLDQTELTKAIGTLEDFITDYPESDAAPEARATIDLARDRLARKHYESGRMYYRLGYYKSASIYFQTVIDDYTDTEWAARSFYYMAEIELKEKHYQDAQTKFNHFLVVYGDHEYAKKAKDKLAEIDKHLATIDEGN